MSEKPSIFISSTVHDFEDLRSALKQYLVSLGYDVFLSEFTDFPKQLDANAFEASLATLRRADFYVLLVGSRVGSLYDAREGVSITRKEYRTAYELAREGRIRLALFVRDRIWALRHDRQALGQFLVEEFASERELTEDEIERLVNHPGAAVNDPKHVWGFIDEIARKVETDAAVQGRGELPAANWVHTFSSFADIVDALGVHLRISSPLSRVALQVNLRKELLDNLTLMTEKVDGQVCCAYNWVVSARKRLQGDMDSQSQMPGNHLRWALMYSLFSSSGSKISTFFIDQAVKSGEFLEYDSHLGEFVSSQFNERLFQLRERIGRFRRNAGIVSEQAPALMSKYWASAQTDRLVSIPNQDLVILLGLADIEADIVNLSIALLRSLDGDDTWLAFLTLNPSTPIEAEAERIAKETPCAADIEEWVRAQASETRVAGSASD